MRDFVDWDWSRARRRKSPYICQEFVKCRVVRVLTLMFPYPLDRRKVSETELACLFLRQALMLLHLLDLSS